MILKDLKSAPRLLMEVELRPVQGDRFQPTGFPDLGAAVYISPKGKRMLLVESAQSIANRLEQTCLEGGRGPGIIKELEGLPYILVELNVKLDTNEIKTKTSSLVEAHRINSPFIIYDEEFRKHFIDKAGYSKGKPLNWEMIGKAFFFYDPNSLLHGAFMSNLEDGRIKVPRAITGFIEAEDVQEVASGGAKIDFLDPTGKIRIQGIGKDVYGNVLYHRMEYTAKRITAYFNIDLALLDGYGLEPEAKELLVALGLYKIRRFLASGLRLRTACDLIKNGDIKVTAPNSFQIPSEKELLEVIQANIKACKDKNLFADPPVTVLDKEAEVGDKKGSTTSEEGATIED